MSLQLLKVEFICKISIQLLYLNAFLLHAVAVTHRYCAIVLRIEIVCNAERRPDFILPPITLANIPTVVKLAIVFLGQLRKDFLRPLVQLLGQGKHANLHRSQSRMEMEYIYSYFNVYLFIEFHLFSLVNHTYMRKTFLTDPFKSHQPILGYNNL